MPYIKLNDRANIDLGAHPQTAGELNFCITKLIMRYLRGKNMNYQRVNDCLGALEGAKLEFYRRVVAPYENMKCEENGDVYR